MFVRERTDPSAPHSLPAPPFCGLLSHHHHHLQKKQIMDEGNDWPLLQAIGQQQDETGAVGGDSNGGHHQQHGPQDALVHGILRALSQVARQGCAVFALDDADTDDTAEHSLLPWPCYNYVGASETRFPSYRQAMRTVRLLGRRRSEQRGFSYYYHHHHHHGDAMGSVVDPWGPGGLAGWWWRWAMDPEMTITWICLGILLLVVGCCWISSQLSDWLCKIAVILCLSTVLVSVVLGFISAAAATTP